jgi:hypothetical protein
MCPDNRVDKVPDEHGLVDRRTSSRTNGSATSTRPVAARAASPSVSVRSVRW